MLFSWNELAGGSETVSIDYWREIKVYFKEMPEKVNFLKQEKLFKEVVPVYGSLEQQLHDGVYALEGHFQVVF